MTRLNLELNENATETMRELAQHYQVNDSGIIKKAIALLKIVSYIEQTNGELLARKGNHETRIIVR